MKKPLKTLAKLIFFLLSLFLILFRITDYFKDRNVVELSRFYYDYEKETFDVLFFGTSILYSGISPMMLWDEYGIVSYNLGSGNESIPMSYYLMKDGIERDHPKAVVLDTSFVTNEGKRYYLPYVHYVTDNMPLLSANRLLMILDVVEEKRWDEFLVPFIAYHSFIKDVPDHYINQKDPYRPLRINFGGRTVKRKYSGPLFERHGINKENVLQDVSLEYILKMKSLCDQTGTKFLLITLPVIGPNDNCSQDEFDKRRNAAYAMEDFAAEHHIDYINMVDMPEELDLTADDTYDGFHLNIYGNEKIAHFLGGYLVNNYAVPDRREEPKYSFMNEAYEVFLQWKNNLKTD